MPGEIMEALNAGPWKEKNVGMEGLMEWVSEDP